MSPPRVAYFYFKNGIPKFKTIKAQFYENTGLQLNLIVELNLEEITTTDEEVINLLREDILRKEKLKNAMDKKRDLDHLNQLYSVQFCVGTFEPILYSIKPGTNIISIRYRFKNKLYFPELLQKTFFDVGGIPVQDYEYPATFSDERVEEMVQSWKKFKKWHDYKWYNRPRK